MKKVLLICSSLFTLFFTNSAEAFGRKYTEMQLSQDTFVVSIKATSTTSQNKAYSGLLTRAAEITLKNGCSFFIIKENKDQFEEKMSYNSYLTTQLTKKSIPHGQITIQCLQQAPKDSEGKEVVDAKLFLATKK